MTINMVPSSHRAEPHTETQLRMLDRLASLYVDLGDYDKAAGLMFEREVVIASSATAKRYPATFRLQKGQ